MAKGLQFINFHFHVDNERIFHYLNVLEFILTTKRRGFHAESTDCETPRKSEWVDWAPRLSVQTTGEVDWNSAGGEEGKGGMAEEQPDWTKIPEQGSLY